MDKNLEVGCRPDAQSIKETREQRIKTLREAFLQGRLKVDSQQLASKIIAFEKEFDSTVSQSRKTSS